MMREHHPPIQTLTPISTLGRRRYGFHRQSAAGLLVRTDPSWRKPWRLPAGTAYPDILRLWNDDNPPGHWTWAPAYDMPLTDFKIALAMVTSFFKPYP